MYWKCELKVKKIVHLQRLVEKLADTFTSPKIITKLDVSDANALINFNVLEGQINIAHEPKVFPIKIFNKEKELKINMAKLRI